MCRLLYSHQEEALRNMKNGCILNGGVGSGKSRTALAYYYFMCGGDLVEMKPMLCPKDLYVITTAQKRDKKEWEGEFVPFLIGSKLYSCKAIVDSWNNIKKYADVENSFFIFDEDRVTGNGTWVKTFLKIAKKNEWIILSATPGDTWMDYIPVFVANGFYRNRTEFIRRHVVYKRFVKFPMVDRYVDEGRLIKLRRKVLVNMDCERNRELIHEDVWCDYDTDLYKRVLRTRFNPYKEEPIINAGELCYTLRKIVNSDESRILKVMELAEDNPRLIIFYNFDYELEMLKGVSYGVDVEVAEWNGHKHQAVPDCDRWVYLVQYTAGCEGWNCIKTNTIIFYSQNYSYKVMTQAAGRIDRLNTPFPKLYFYHLKSRSGIDLGIMSALKKKKNFNERDFVGET